MHYTYSKLLLLLSALRSLTCYNQRKGKKSFLHSVTELFRPLCIQYYIKYYHDGKGVTKHFLISFNVYMYILKERFNLISLSLLKLAFHVFWHAPSDVLSLLLNLVAFFFIFWLVYSYNL